MIDQDDGVGTLRVSLLADVTRRVHAALYGNTCGDELTLCSHNVFPPSPNFLL